MSEPPSARSVIEVSWEHDTPEQGASERWIAEAVDFLGLPAVEVSVVIGDDGLLHRLNAEYRGKDKPTDVLSFPQFDGDPDAVLAALTAEAAAPEPPALGDVVISWDQVGLQAEAYGETPEQVLQRLLVHGLLHLLGYDHETGDEDARVMFAQEEACLAHLTSRRSV